MNKHQMVAALLVITGLLVLLGVSLGASNLLLQGHAASHVLACSGVLWPC
jgi:hypothetical protein